MSESCNKCDSGIVETLQNFKPVLKPKLTHILYEDEDSSPGSSPPIQRRASRNVVINLDSDSEDSNEKTAVTRTNGIAKVDELVVIDLVENDTASDSGKSEIVVQSNSEAITKKLDVKTNKQTVYQLNIESSDDDIIRPIKRKKPALKDRKSKRKRKENSGDYSDSNGNLYQKQHVYDSDGEDNISANSAPRKKVVEFLDSANEKDFLTVPYMNEKKIELIISNRPFTNWDQAICKFREEKGLKCSLLNNISDAILATDVLKELLTKCEELAAKTEREIISSGTLVLKTPSLLNPEMTLSSHQMIGLNWLVLMRSEELNSILADEMGLGKTIQIIAFLAYLKEMDMVETGFPHLVVVPSSTLNNWYEEFQKWCPSLKVVMYHGNQHERRYLRHVWFKDGFGDAEVILTTYSCAVSSREEKKMFRIKEFNYIVFDEAHMLKNMNTQRYEALFQFNGHFKILLTGTPLQNNLLELISLLVILMPKLFRNKINHVKLLFSKSRTLDENSTDYEKERVYQAKRIIEPFMLRRLKEDVLKDLPRKIISVKKCSMTPDQQSKYDQLVEDFKFDVAMKDNNCHMVYFMLMRKMANHPLLLRYHFTLDKLKEMAELLTTDATFKGQNKDHIADDLYFKSDFELNTMCQEMESLKSLNFSLPDECFNESGKLKVLTPMLHSLKESGHRVLIFSQFVIMLDILEEYCKIQDFGFLRFDGSTKTDERQELINLFNSEREIFIFLLSTKAGGLGINLTSADTVIMHDVDFNPYNDKQAEDRCHRIGQTKPVQVYKLVSENTVEEGMLNTAIKKLYLEKEVTARNDDSAHPESKSVMQLLKETLGL